MKQAKSGKRIAAPKKGSPPRNVDAYMASVPEAALSNFTKLRSAIRSAVPAEAIEIISYRIPAFKYDGRVLVWFAAFSRHCSLFPTAAVLEEFKDELKAFSTSKGTIHFPIDKPLPTSLVKRLVKERVSRSKGARGR